VPTIGVCVPTRNRANLLPHCLDSVLAQTRPPDLVIISDDGSTDATESVVRRYVGLMSGRGIVVHCFHHEPPLGQEANRRFSFQAAETEFVTMLDDDDQWRPQFLERAAGALELTPDAAFASCSQVLIDASGQELPRESDILAVASGRSMLEAGVYEHVMPLIIAGMPFMLGATVFRRAALAKAGFVPRGSGLVCDWAVMCAVAAGGRRMVYLAEPLSLYRVHAQGRASDELAFRRDGYLWARRLFLDGAMAEYRDILRKRAIRGHQDLMMDLAHGGQRAVALAEALRLARTWGVSALGRRGLVYLPLVLLGADRLRRGRRLPAAVPCGGLLPPALRPRRCGVLAC
jgi:glycosyltransferase involved in cell wall biosynthesis